MKYIANYLGINTQKFWFSGTLAFDLRSTSVVLVAIAAFLYMPLVSVFLIAYNFLFADLLSDREERTFSIVGIAIIVYGVLNYNHAQITQLFAMNHALFYNFNPNVLSDYTNLFFKSGLYLSFGVVVLGLSLFRPFRFAIKLQVDAAANSTQATSSANPDSDNQVHLGMCYQQRVDIADNEFNQHALVIGTTGSGKTTTLMNVVESCAKRGLPLIYLDGKGSIKLVNRIKEICDKHNRVLKVFSVNPDNIPNLACYNPLAHGNFSIWKNKIISLVGESENKGQEHYQIKEQSYINLVCEILYRSGHMVDLEGFLGYLRNPDEIQRLANLIDPDLALRLVEESNSKEETVDLIKVIEMFYYSHYGKLFSTNGKANCINLKESIENGEMVLFLLDASSYKRDTKLLGRLIINDINSAYSEFGHSGIRHKAYCIFDEFGAYASPNMADVLAMQRDNGLHAIVGTQSINAISKDSMQVRRIAVELIANCNTFIIHRINDPQDVSELSNVIGTNKKLQLNSVDPEFGSTILGVMDKNILEPQQIRELQTGEAWVCRLSKNIKPQKVKINYLGG